MIYYNNLKSIKKGDTFEQLSQNHHFNCGEILICTGHNKNGSPLFTSERLRPIHLDRKEYGITLPKNVELVPVDLKENKKHNGQVELDLFFLKSRRDDKVNEINSLKEELKKLTKEKEEIDNKMFELSKTMKPVPSI